ncbi:MAG: hypothetical protein AVDCRST_MAG31-931 [uncultured Sphingomonas sp.]|uniref:PhnA-like protein n=1 Tax=uncultured Sphingomonas sp. TaxID=158754 RepID=A0A6J4T2K9_9SPHN|nr:hypothetical protein [uncultured Sphingomonas sp.]CAA9511669.1 MAG: hypothetical protein AVDCRST_MAG31-931 [uncultured Sphingomonas sp.]
MDSHPDTPRNRGDKDAPHFSPVNPAEDLRTIQINQINWGAVLAGVAVGLITQLVLNMLGVGIGLATLDPGTSDNPSAGGLGIGAGIWWVLSGIIASFLGGWIAGRLAGKPRESTGGLHGLTAWAVTALIVIYMLTSALGSILGGALGVVGNAASGVASTASTAATAAAPAAAGQGGEIVDVVQNQVREATGGVDISDTAGAVISGATSDDPAERAQARERAAQAYARSQGVPIEQARVEVARTEQRVGAGATQVRETATRAADTATTAASTAALVSAISLLLGALAAWFGGRKGAVQPTVTRAAGTSVGSSSAGTSRVDPV